MKKWIAVVLALILALSLVACGQKDQEAAVAGKVEPNEDAAVPAATGSVEPATAATEPEIQETEPAEEETKAADETPVSMGRMEGGTYINEYVGYGCDLDSSWVYYGAEELQELPENVKELIADTELGAAMEGIGQFTDMMAENVEMMSTVNVLYQKLSMQERMAFAMVTDEEIWEETLAQKDLMIEAYAQMGTDVESIEKTTITFLGEERCALRTVANTQGVPHYVLQVIDARNGQYSVTLTATSFVEDNTQAVLDLFYPVN